MSSTRPSPDRRAFLATLAAAGAVTALRPEIVVAAAHRAPESLDSQEWDLSWLDTLTGAHKQGERTPLRVPRNYLNAAREVLKKEFPEVNTVIGIASSAFPINVSDAIWAKYQLGEKWNVKDPATGTWSTRNIYSARPGTPAFSTSVEGLQARGTIFWQCNNALGGIAAQFASETGRPAAEIRTELIAGFMPGVKLIPAHTLLIGMVQERGCSYEMIL
jgi:hypothetical protein